MLIELLSAVQVIVYSIPSPVIIVFQVKLVFHLIIFHIAFIKLISVLLTMLIVWKAK